jgi:VanZ family protein
LILGLLFAGIVFLFLGVAVGWESREFPTLWLPLALAASVGALLALVPDKARMPLLVGVAICCGVLLLWMLSEPMVKLGLRPELRNIAVVLACLCAVAEAFLLGRAVSGPADVRIAFRWAAGLVLMSWLIAYFSSPSGGSGGMLSLAMHTFGLTAEQADLAVKALRKTIHFCFYGLLGWTAYRWALAMGTGPRRAAVFGLGVALAHAAFDEGRQTFYPDRTGSAWDVLLDVSGAAAFVSVSARRRRLA